MGVKIVKKCSKWRNEKSRRFGVFLVRFLSFWTAIDAYRIYRKTAPTKSTVLGPGPPPGEKWKFIEFYRFFMILGPSIEPEKASPKSASTANPPQKCHFIAFLYFGTRLFVFFSKFLVWVVWCVLFCPLRFLVLA
jgi:hypothetical protein